MNILKYYAHKTEVQAQSYDMMKGHTYNGKLRDLERFLPPRKNNEADPARIGSDLVGLGVAMEVDACEHRAPVRSVVADEARAGRIWVSLGRIWPEDGAGWRAATGSGTASRRRPAVAGSSGRWCGVVALSGAGHGGGAHRLGRGRAGRAWPGPQRAGCGRHGGGQLRR